MKPINEEFLQFVWDSQLFGERLLRTVSGEMIRVIDRGKWNYSSGPDFSNAVIRIGETIWAGNIEVHIRSSDWYRHNHHLDKAYDNVVLHVVAEDDRVVHIRNETPVPCLVLSDEHFEELHGKYTRWFAQKEGLPCDGLISFTPRELLNSWLEHLADTRFMRKREAVIGCMEAQNGDVRTTEMIMTAAAFGQPLNSDPMMYLIRAIPWNSVLRKDWEYADLEQWLLTISGLSDRPQELYYERIWGVEPMDKSVWKYGGIRPASFPEVRIRQWFFWLWQRFVLSGAGPEVLLNPDSGFWTSDTILPLPGRSVRIVWAVNLLPLYSVLHQYYNDHVSAVRVSWSDIPPEMNKVVRRYVQQGIAPQSACDTQAILEMEALFCRSKKCVNCAIGRYHMNRAEYDRQDKNGI